MSSANKTDFLKELGARVRQYRTERGMSQEELANLVGYTSEYARSSINKIEAGKSDLPASKISALADALCVPVGRLMGWEEFDQKLDTESIQSKVSALEVFQASFGKSLTDTVTMLLSLDESDLCEIRGEMKQMLKSEKYRDN